MDIELRTLVREASLRPEVHAAVQRVYRELQDQIDLRRPQCVMSGRCCRFEEFGHRLFVTTLELAAFVAQTSQAPSTDWGGTGCPFQQGKLCGAHATRPFGCRVFFCDSSSTQWQQETYERFHGEIKRLHEKLEVPYVYLEWREALRALGLAPLVHWPVKISHSFPSPQPSPEGRGSRNIEAL